MTDIFQQMAETGAPKPETAEVKLDLGQDGVVPDEKAALEKLTHVLAYCRKSGAESLYVSFPPAKPGETRSLFQPVAKMIAAAKQRGEVAQALPLMGGETAGIFVKMAR